MKKTLALCLCAIIIASAATACTAKTNTDSTSATGSEPITEIYNLSDVSDLMTPQEIMDDVSVVDFNLSTETEGLKKVEEKDDESATAKIKYYDRNDNLVYVKYIGYGEDCFDYYTKSKSGREIVVKYILQDGKTFAVDVECDDYTVGFNELSITAKYCAKQIYVTAIQEADDDFPKTASYEYDGKQFNLTENRFYSADGYHCYTCYYEGDTCTEDDYVMYKKVDSAPTNDDLNEMLDDHRVKDAEIILGEHRLEYIEKADRDKQWFVVADIHIVFNSEKGAEQFANKYGLNYQLSEYGERYYTVCLKDTAIAVDEEFDDFIEFASQEYNDYIFGKIKLTDNGTLVDISTNESSLVYY